LIKPGGENVYPAEVEKVILQHPAVEKTVVIGVPDPKWKEAIKAVCQLRKGQTLKPGPDRFCGERIAPVQETPGGASSWMSSGASDGSVDRAEVKKRYGDAK